MILQQIFTPQIEQISGQIRGTDGKESEGFTKAPRGFLLLFDNPADSF